jgi:hypothetical protein
VLANNGGDISKTLKDLGSSSTVKNTLVAIATAGVGTSVAGQGVSAVAAQTAAGCATGAATGAGCEQGAKTAAVLSTAGETYQLLVGYAANAGPGENRSAAETGDATYNADPATGRLKVIDQGRNITGDNELGKFCSQGSACSKAANQLPFINATAGLHDWLFNEKTNGNFTLDKSTLNNWGTMLPSAVVAVPASLNDPSLSWMLNYRPNTPIAPVVPSVVRVQPPTWQSMKSNSLTQGCEK